MHRNRDEELRGLPQVRYIPNFVFLDSTGKKVFETRGFNTVREAKALHEFVSRKLYLKSNFGEFLSSYPDS